MDLKFIKYQGTGNDFIILDNSQGNIHLSNAQITLLCDRNFSIGSDGLILIQKDSDTNFEMVFYNPDTSMSFCGNGSRCAVKYARELNLIGNTGSFRAIDGIHEFKINTDSDNVSIKMGDVDEIIKKEEDFFIDTGSPHYIHFSQNEITNFDIIEFGRQIRYSEQFKAINGTNVNVIHKKDQNTFEMRTYERGVENETLSCGTGVTAGALAFGKKYEKNDINIITRGGNLNVNFKKSNNGFGFDNIWLTGPAVKVFEGVIRI